MQKIGLFIPTLNAGENWHILLQGIVNQDFLLHKKLIIDSGSTDKTTEIAEDFGFEIININPTDFDHGGTRNLASDHLSDCDIIIYLTQDVLLFDSTSLKNLVMPFDDEKIACTYGRQLPHETANPLAIHARSFNYPAKSLLKSKQDITTQGFKTCFMSNSFAAYRTKDLFNEKGFPNNSIFGEDAILASKFILNGKKIYYNSDAKVFHSHSYSVKQEFKRYFDIGVFHQSNSWIREKFGSPKGEGLKYAKSELSYTLKTAPLWIFRSILSTIVKLLAYQLGTIYYIFPLFLIKKLSMNKLFWIKHAKPISILE